MQKLSRPAIMWCRILNLSAYLVLIISLGGYAEEIDGRSLRSVPLIFTTLSQTTDGRWCITDCADGRCAVDKEKVANCHRSDKPAPTFYTTRKRYPDQYKCTSRCAILDGDDRPRCFVDYDWNKLDYCNPDITSTFEYRDYTFDNGPCVTDCKPKSASSTNLEGLAEGYCYDISEKLRECFVDKKLYETTYTISGHSCNGECSRYEGTSYNWCYYAHGQWDYCARPALYLTTCHHCMKSRNSNLRNLGQEESVPKYAERMERDPDYTTVTVSAPDNPIYSYTYNETMTPSGRVRLPLVVRARVCRSHIQPRNSRGNHAISSASRRNCRLMGMGPVDAVGHLIAYKLGGPADFYNFVPMTRSINIGSVTGGTVYAPSVWAATERETAEFIEDEDGQASIVVVLRYNFNDPVYPYRPYRIGWGQWNRASNGDGVLSCLSYWYNNEYDAEDPECYD